MSLCNRCTLLSSIASLSVRYSPLSCVNLSAPSCQRKRMSTNSGSSARVADNQAQSIWLKSPMLYRPRLESDFDTAYPLEVRKYLGTWGLTPPSVESHKNQVERCLRLLDARPTPLDKYQYLSHLRVTNVHLFYRLLLTHIKELTPIIYTPTVGEACLKWSELYTQPEGLYISYSDKGNISSVLQNWSHDVEIAVVSDGSRILGLGDLGVNGMGIPVGKLALYTACAGIRPDATLPLMLDLGTSNKKLREDPLYMGSRMEKVSCEEELEFLDELMFALTERWPGILIQFEDFKNPFPALERYQNTYTCFNDDIQGTGAVILGGFINAVKRTGLPITEQRAVFLGAGSAGVGVAKQMAEFFMMEGLTEDEARRKFWLVDSKGLVTNDRGDELASHKTYFSRDDNNGQQFKSLLEIVDYVKPNILIGLSTIGGAFDKDILTRMGELNDRPVIFPLSNPCAKSECTFEEAVKYAGEQVLFASGSPFPTLELNGKTLTPGQGNNMYVFPGIGLGSILCKAVNVNQEMIYASASALSESLSEEEVQNGYLYPDILRIRHVSALVAKGVIRAAQKSGVDRQLVLRNLNDAELEQYIQDHMYNPAGESDLVKKELELLTSEMTLDDASAPVRKLSIAPAPGKGFRL